MLKLRAKLFACAAAVLVAGCSMQMREYEVTHFNPKTLTAQVRDNQGHTFCIRMTADPKVALGNNPNHWPIMATITNKDGSTTTRFMPEAHATYLGKSRTEALLFLPSQNVTEVQVVRSELGGNYRFIATTDEGRAMVFLPR